MKNIKGFFANFKNPRFRRGSVLVAVLLLLSTGVFIFEKRVDRVFIDNSLASTPVVSVAPSAPSDLKRLYVHEGQSVKTGDPIADVGNQTIHADSDGLVVRVNDALGIIVSSQNPVAEIIDPTNLRIDGTLDETKGLKDIKVGQPVSFSIDAYPGRTYWGYVDEVSPTAKSTQISFTVSSERPVQQFEVFAKFNSFAYPEIKNGMSAKMTVYTK